MHDGEQQITDWRRALAAKIGPDAGILAELEGHVRDEIDRLVRQGQTPDQAAWAAIAKIGTPEKLAPEFAKNAVAWWPIRCVFVGTALVVAFCLYFFSQAVQRRPLDALLFAHITCVTIGYSLTYAIGILALCYALRRMVRDLCVGQKTSWLRALRWHVALAFTTTLLGTVLGGIWANREWGHFWNWDLKETGALTTLIWQGILLALVFRRPDKTRWLLCWAVLGDIIVTFAWFVASTLSGQVHSYGQNGQTMLIIFLAIFVSHLLVIAGALAPSGWLRLRKLTS